MIAFNKYTKHTTFAITDESKQSYEKVVSDSHSNYINYKYFTSNQLRNSYRNIIIDKNGYFVTINQGGILVLKLNAEIKECQVMKKIWQLNQNKKLVEI